jgi:predicted nucleic acid-binding protein
MLGRERGGCDPPHAETSKMVCVDTNVICYRCMASPHSGNADAAWAKDPDWIAPLLWRSEFRNTLAGALRWRLLTTENAIAITNLAESILAQNEFMVSTSAVLQLVSRSGCSAYDCEFVAVARQQGVRLLTLDRQILHDFPETAVSLQKFVHE